MFRVKKGSSVSFLMNVSDKDTNLPIHIGNWSVLSNVKQRKEDEDVVGTFNVTVLNAATGSLRLNAETHDWPIGLLMFDIRFLINGEIVVYSSDIELMIEATAT